MTPLPRRLVGIIRKLLGEHLFVRLYQVKNLFYYRYNPFEILKVRRVWASLGVSQTAYATAKVQRARPHVLFVTEKWHGCDPQCGLTNNAHNLWGSLEASGLATQDRFHFDEYYYQHHQAGDGALLEQCVESRPDLVVLNWLIGLPLPCNPKLETLRLIHAEMKIPIVSMLFDSVSPYHMSAAELILPFVDLCIIGDSTTAYLQATRYPQKYLPLWAPQDPSIFSNPGLNRDIGISFVGSVESYGDRRDGIAALRAAGVEVFRTGGHSEGKLPIEDYAMILKRSKIALNFCASFYQGRPQYKGRVFEATLCGALLLETDNSETAQWFEPMVDYVPFRSAADLVDKARYYLEHDSEREQIALRGYQKAQERYTGATFWRAIFDRMFEGRQTKLL